MYEYDWLNVALSFVVTWTIGLVPPLVIRHAALRRPLNRFPAIAVCVVLWFVNILIFTALDSQSKYHAALVLVAIISYGILTRKYESRLAVSSAEVDGEQVPAKDEKQKSGW